MGVAENERAIYLGFWPFNRSINFFEVAQVLYISFKRGVFTDLLEMGYKNL